MPCDESFALGGIRAGGNRSGGVFRLTGTVSRPRNWRGTLPNRRSHYRNNVPTPIEEIRKRGRQS